MPRKYRHLKDYEKELIYYCKILYHIIKFIAIGCEIWYHYFVYL